MPPLQVGRGQVVGMQLFLTLLYIGSGFCKLGPTFPHMFTINLACSKFMVDVPWAHWFRNVCAVAAHGLSRALRSLIASPRARSFASSPAL